MEIGIIPGRVPVHEYLSAGLFTKQSSLIIQDTIKKSLVSHITSFASSHGIPVRRMTKHDCMKAAPGETSQGVMLTHAPLYTELDTRSYADLASADSVLVMLDQITDPHNAGAIIRSAESFGAQGVIIPAHRQAPVTSTTVKSSAGATAHIPICTVSNLAQEIDVLKSHGFWIAGSSDHGREPLHRLREVRPLVCIIGSEGDGMRRLTEKKCDYVCTIPMRGHVSSLNASVAAGILLHTALADS